MTKFEQDIKTGKIGEKLAREILEKSSNTVSVIDCSDDKFFQALDIDYLVETKSGRVIKYEVKTDTQAHRTGNMVWEATTSGHIGCFEKTSANYILYYLSGNGKLYGFWVKPMRRYVHRYNLRKVRMGDSATGYLMNIEDLVKKHLIKEIDYGK